MLPGIGSGIDLIRESATLDDLLEPLRGSLGADFEGYRGHLYRALTYAMHFVGGDRGHRAFIEAVLVYHDIGLWTDGDLAYLGPSIDRALAANTANSWDFDTKLLHDTIHSHHKLTPFRGPGSEVVNAVRRADWIDATGGRRRMGLSKAQVKAVTDSVPEAGFSDAVNRLVVDLGGSKMRGHARVLRHVYKL